MGEICVNIKWQLYKFLIDVDMEYEPLTPVTVTQTLPQIPTDTCHAPAYNLYTAGPW